MCLENTKTIRSSLLATIHLIIFHPHLSTIYLARSHPWRRRGFQFSTELQIVCKKKVTILCNGFKIFIKSIFEGLANFLRFPYLYCAMGSKNFYFFFVRLVGKVQILWEGDKIWIKITSLMTAWVSIQHRAANCVQKRVTILCTMGLNCLLGLIFISIVVE